MDGLFVKGYIYLDDIPEECIGTSKAGKKYFNFTIAERRSVGQYGETHALYISRPKPHIGGEKIEYEKVYIGSARPFKKEG